MRRLLAAWLLLGCGTPKPLPALDVHAVAWTDAPLGRVAAVAETDDAITVFGDRGAVVLVGGVEVAVDASVTRWVSAAAMPAADGNGVWMVGADADGRLWRVRDRQRLERIGARFGLEDRPVRAVVPLGQGRTAFGLGPGLALTDGLGVTRYDYTFTAIAGGAGRGVGITQGSIRVFDPFGGVDRTFTVPEAGFVALDARGNLVAANAQALWVQQNESLKRVHLATHGPLHGLAASGDRVWFAEGAALGAVQGETVSESSGLGLPDDATLLPAGGGDVWTLSAGTLRRWSLRRGAETFATEIAPIVRRVCSKCHGAGTMFPLLSSADWEGLRATILERVVQKKTMPPKDVAFTDAERAAIAAWGTR